MSTYERFRGTPHLPSLDGLRAVSIILVLFAHSGDDMWVRFHGTQGVALFFIVSGLLITTLLLREEEDTGAVSFGAFWIRRTFRIVPLYLLALAVFTFTRLGLGLGEGTDDFGHRLIYFVTFTNELSGDGTFGHSWSLGVEEKFYLVWPVLAFASAALSRHRAALISALTVASLVSWLIETESYLALYLPIFLGCSLALLLHDRRTFELLSRLAGRVTGPLLVGLAVVALFVFEPVGNVMVPFALVAVLAFPALLLGDSFATRGLATRALVHVGKRSYAMYLFHPLVGEVITKAIDEDATTGPALVRMALLFGLSLGFAEVLYRTVEQPLVAVGRRKAAAWKLRGTSQAAPVLPG